MGPKMSYILGKGGNLIVTCVGGWVVTLALAVRSFNPNTFSGIDSFIYKWDQKSSQLAMLQVEELNQAVSPTQKEEKRSRSEMFKGASLQQETTRC